MSELNRDIVEDYLIYLRTEEGNRQSYAKDLCHLKSLLRTASLIHDWQSIDSIILLDDYEKTPYAIYKTYTDEELNRLNTAIANIDIQVARVIFLQQLLGTRISEVLTLKKDCINTDASGHLMIRIHQSKTGKTYQKPITDEIMQIIDSAVEYSQQRYDNPDYIFVMDKDPARPMTYSRVQNCLMRMIAKNDLRDDHGERFRVGTHIFRHNYGKTLAEMDYDDKTIATLMGHSDTSSLRHYRKIGNQKMAKETNAFRQNADKLIRDVTKNWE